MKDIRWFWLTFAIYLLRTLRTKFSSFGINGETPINNLNCVYGKTAQAMQGKGNENFLLMENNKFGNVLLVRAQAERHNRRKFVSKEKSFGGEQFAAFPCQVKMWYPGEPITNWAHKLRLWIQINPKNAASSQATRVRLRRGLNTKPCLTSFRLITRKVIVPEFAPQGHIQSEPRGYRKNTRHSQLVRRQMVPVNTRKICVFRIRSHFLAGHKAIRRQFIIPKSRWFSIVCECL